MNKTQIKLIEVGDKVRLKSFNQVIMEKGVDDYYGLPRIYSGCSENMLKHFGGVFTVSQINDESYYKDYTNFIFAEIPNMWSEDTIEELLIPKREKEERMEKLGWKAVDPDTTAEESRREVLRSDVPRYTHTPAHRRDVYQMWNSDLPLGLVGIHQSDLDDIPPSTSKDILMEAIDEVIKELKGGGEEDDE